MRQDIKNLIAQGKIDQIKDSIVKSIRDFKRLGDSMGEVSDTIHSMYGEQFMSFFYSQWKLL